MVSGSFWGEAPSKGFGVNAKAASKVRCECGTLKEVRNTTLVSGLSTSCGGCTHKSQKGLRVALGAQVGKKLTLARLREVLAYDKDTGVFTWCIGLSGRAAAGSLAGNLDSKGYLRLNVDKEQYACHRLAWFYIYGEWPVRAYRPHRQKSLE